MGTEAPEGITLTGRSENELRIEALSLAERHHPTASPETVVDTARKVADFLRDGGETS